MHDLIVLGGGVAGFFGAINYARKNPKKRVAIFERSSQCLSKLRITGGGKGNIGFAENNSKKLASNYPRGHKVLPKLFDQFKTDDLKEWLKNEKIEVFEEDGMLYPKGQSSNTIIDVLIREAEKNKIQVETGFVVKDFLRRQGKWNIIVEEDTYVAEKILVTTGGNKLIWEICEKLGHKVIPSVPTLFTFEIQHSLSPKGDEIRMENVDVAAIDSELSVNGHVTITKTGFEGEAIKRLASLGAKPFFDLDYNFIISVNWLSRKLEEVQIELHEFRISKAERKVNGVNPFDLPKPIWQRMCKIARVDTKKYDALTDEEIQQLAMKICKSVFQVKGKVPNKKEFVTSGGVELDEIELTTMESKLRSNLFFAGEVLNIDGFSGGFNIQSAWTTAWIASQAM